MMAHRKSHTLIIISSLLLLLLLIPIFCEATDQHDAESEETASGEVAEVPRPVLRPGYGASPDDGPEEGEEEEESDSAVSLAPASAAADSEEETDQQSTPSSVAAVGKDSSHLPRDLDESDESEEEDDDSEEHDTEEPEAEENDELTTVLAVSSSSLPLAPIPPKDQDHASHEDSDSSPNNETLRPEPSQTVIIWDGTGEPDREVTNNEPEHPVPQPEDKPVSQTERPVDQPEQPHSEELTGGGANGNGHTKENKSDGEDKSHSEGEAPEDRPGVKYDPVMSTGSTSSSPMAWVVVFAVVSSALLISGMYESESDRDSSCHFGCRHNFDDFNPYAWPPTPARRNETTLRPIT